MQLTVKSYSKSESNRLVDRKYLSIFTIFLLFVAVLHHAAFCFINTHLVHVKSSYLILTELMLLGSTFLFFIRNVSIGFLTIFIFIFANAFILTIFQQGFDPKHIRNFLIPVLMIWLGVNYDNRVLPVDKLVKIIAYIFLIFGLFELLFLDLFQKIFNVLQFQISVGRTQDIAVKYAESSFSLNGTRYGGRNLLSFLGNHRVSSFYLETVNTSNFCTLLAAWGLSKKSFKDGAIFYFIALAIAVLADSRFGVTLILAMTLLRFSLSLQLLKLTAFFSPIFIIAICIYLGWDMTEFNDDFKTRLGSTGRFLMDFTYLEFFGLDSNHYSPFVDQGYARVLHFNGIVFLLSIWIIFCRMQVNLPIFKYLVAIIIASNLAISGDSVFSFKWTALLWFLLGTTIIVRKKN